MSISVGPGNRRVNPVARNPGAFDVNVLADTRCLAKQQSRARFHGNQPTFFQSSDPEAYNIMAREPLMARRQNGSRYRGRALHCISSANGLGRNGQSKRDILKELVWGGVAVTGYNLHGDKAREQQGFVSSFGGLNTITNTGQHTIYPGDILRVNLPDITARADIGKANNFRVPEGVPVDKLLFAIEPVAQTRQDVIAEAQEIVLLPAPAADMPDAAKETHDEELVDAVRAILSEQEDPALKVRDVLQACMKYCHSQRRFEIGRALSYAKPGHSLDVCLG